MRTEPVFPSRWGLTLGLLVLAAVASAFAPRLSPPPPEPADVDSAADFCLTVGQFECCYKEPKR